MSVRTQITLPPEMQRRAHDKAAELGISFAEYIRRLALRDLGRPKRKVDVSVLFDLGSSLDPTDIAKDKDAMIAEASEKEYSRKGGLAKVDKARRS
jgi:hypothetical protein